MGNPIERAQADRLRLEALIKQYDGTIAHYERERDVSQRELVQIETFLQVYDRYAKDDPSQSIVTPPRAAIGPNVTEVVIGIAQEINRGGVRARTEDVYRRALDAGLVLSGGNETSQKNNIAGILSRSGLFDAIRGKGYWWKALGAYPDDATYPVPMEAKNFSEQERVVQKATSSDVFD